MAASFSFMLAINLIIFPLCFSHATGKNVFGGDITGKDPTFLAPSLQEAFSNVRIKREHRVRRDTTASNQSSGLIIKSDRLGPGEILSVKSGELLRMRQTLWSPNKTYKLVMLEEGSTAVYPGNYSDFTNIWTIHSTMVGEAKYLKNHPIILHMQPDGNLVLYNSKQEMLWESGTNENKFAGAHLRLEDDGALCLFQPLNSRICLWKSSVTEVKSGEVLRMRQILWSTNKKTKLIIKEDGSTVVYPGNYSDFTKIWTISSTMYIESDSKWLNDHSIKLHMQIDGNLVLYNSKEENVWESGTKGIEFSGVHLRLVDDGALCLFQPADNRHCLWKSAVTEVKSGEVLRMRQTLWSTNKKTKLIIKEDGNTRIYPGNYSDFTNIWTIHSTMYIESDSKWLNDHSIKLHMQIDGNLVLYNSKEENVWESGTKGIEFSGVHLRLEDDGALCLFQPADNRHCLWKSAVTEVKSGEVLRMRQTLWSTNKKTKLIIKEDGNTRIYPGNYSDYTLIWSIASTMYIESDSKWLNDHSIKLHMQIDGNLVLYNSKEENVWESGTKGNEFAGTHLRLEDEGVLCLFQPKNNRLCLWKSAVMEIKSGEYLTMRQTLWSKNKKTKLKMMEDGNVCISEFYNGTCLWRASWTMVDPMTSYKTHHPIKIQMQSDGNIVMSNSIQQRIWESGTNKIKYAESVLSLDDEGSLCLFKDEDLVWKSDVIEIEPGGILLPGNILWSLNRKFNLRLTMDGDAKILDVKKNKYIWFSNTKSPLASYQPNMMKMLTSGNLVIHKLHQSYITLWNSETKGITSIPGASLRLNDDGSICFLKNNICKSQSNFN